MHKRKNGSFSLPCLNHYKLFINWAKYIKHTCMHSYCIFYFFNDDDDDDDDGAGIISWIVVGDGFILGKTFIPLLSHGNS